MITRVATESGVLFIIGFWMKNVQFPLQGKGIWIERLQKSDLRNAVFELEQLWQRSLASNTSHGGILVPYAAFEDLDSESCANLGIIDTDLDLSLREESFFGSSSYSISWRAEYRGVPISHCKRHGYILSSDERIFKLSEKQLELIEYLEQGKSADSVQQAEYQSTARKLADDANAIMSDKLKSNFCLCAESIGFDVQARDDHHIRVIPTVEDIPENVAACLNGTLRTTQLVSDGEKRIRVVCRPAVVERFEQTDRALQGADVPAFLDNPLKYLPEEIHFDPELFSARVKGLKVIRSTAVPFVKIDTNEHSPDWFNMQSGVKLVNEDGQEEILWDEWDQLLDLEDESDYVYRNGQWIYRDPAIIQEYKQAILQARSFAQDGKIPAGRVRQVLEIYDNIDRLEYNEELLAQKARLMDFNEQQFIQPKNLCAELYEYQREGYLWLLKMQSLNMGALLADDMGLGKTLQTIAFIAHLLEENVHAKILLVMPSALIGNWIEELHRFLPSLSRSAIYVHQGANRLRSVDAIRAYTVVLTTYETLARDQVVLAQIYWDFMACDETQKIKNFKTQIANAVKGMHARQRLAMTGTPVENRLSELWSIVDYIQPGLLNTYNWFRKNYEEPIAREGVGNSPKTDALVAQIRPVFLRRTKEEKLDLPEKQEHVVHCPMSKKQEECYREALQKYNDGELKVLPALTQLIEISSHPLLIEKCDELPSVKQMISDSGKHVKTLQILAEIQSKGEKALIFTRYRGMQQILRLAIYHQFQQRPLIINGTISENRMDIIRSFSNAIGFNVMILSPKAAGVGLNITAANHVIHYTREWNPAIENQATDRVYRIGQQKPVHVYYPTCVLENAVTIDEKLSQLLHDKRELMRKVIIPANLEIQEHDLLDALNECNI